MFYVITPLNSEVQWSRANRWVVVKMDAIPSDIGDWSRVRDRSQQYIVSASACDCPSRKNPCKHMQLVDSWLEGVYEPKDRDLPWNWYFDGDIESITRSGWKEITGFDRID